MTDKDLLELLQLSQSTYVDDRTVASVRFAGLTAEDKEFVFRYVDKWISVTNRRKSLYHRIAWTAGSITMLLGSILLYMMLTSYTHGQMAQASVYGALLGGVFGIGLGGFIGGFAWLAQTPPTLAMATTLLSEVDDPRVVGFHCQVLSMVGISPQIRFSIAKSLSQLLIEITEKDQDLLTQAQRESLAKYLVKSKPGRESTLIRAILSALTAVGRRSEIPFVGKFIRRQYLRDSHSELIQLAEEAVIQMHGRADSAVDTDQLLRPQPNSRTPEEQLLRPYSQSAQEKLLLRIGSHDSGGD